MPREITMITPEPVTLAHWQVAACAARWASQPRSLLGSELAGAFSARQERDVVLVAAAGLGTVLTAAASARAQVGDEISRLVPEAAAGRAGPAWWTEAWAPWGPGGAAGVALARAVAVYLGGAAHAAEGE